MFSVVPPGIRLCSCTVPRCVVQLPVSCRTLPLLCAWPRCWPSSWRHWHDQLLGAIFQKAWTPQPLTLFFQFFLRQSRGHFLRCGHTLGTKWFTCFYQTSEASVFSFFTASFADVVTLKISFLDLVLILRISMLELAISLALSSIWLLITYESRYEKKSRLIISNDKSFGSTYF